MEPVPEVRELVPEVLEPVPEVAVPGPEVAVPGSVRSLVSVTPVVPEAEAPEAPVSSERASTGALTSSAK